MIVAGVEAHHGSADYHVDREVTVEGVVKQWRWSSPHTWVLLTVTRSNGSTEEWNGERAGGNLVVSRPWLD